MAKKSKKNNEDDSLMNIGAWSFVLVLIVAVVSAFTRQVFWMLGVLGLIVGLMNVTEKELSLYLLASLTFLLSATTLSITLTKLVGLVPFINQWMSFIDPLLANITLFVAPGAAVVALKALYNVSKD